MSTSVGIVGGSLADLNYWRCAGFSRLMIAPHLQVIHIHSCSAPLHLPTLAMLPEERGEGVEKAAQLNG